MGVLRCCIGCSALCVRCGCCAYTSAGRRNDAKIAPIEELAARGAESVAAEAAELATGDILLMHCTHEFGKMAQVLGKTAWDHVAMVVVLDEAAAADRAQSIAAASLPDSVAGKPGCAMAYPPPRVGGVELLEAVGAGTFSYPLEECLTARGFKYKYTMVRKLTHSTGRRGLDAAAAARVHEAVRTLWGRPYEKNLLESLSATLKSSDPAQGRAVDKSKETLSSIFCSELIAEVCAGATAQLTQPPILVLKYRIPATQPVPSPYRKLTLKLTLTVKLTPSLPLALVAHRCTRPQASSARQT